MNARFSYLFALSVSLSLASCRFVGMKPDFGVMGDTFSPAEQDSVYVESKPSAATPVAAYQPPLPPPQLPTTSSRSFLSQMQNAPAAPQQETPPPTTQVQPPLPAATPAAPTSAPAATSAPRLYTVAPGDTLSRIARQHNVPLGSLAEANGIDLQSPLIKAGQQLRIPQGGGAIIAPPRSAALPATPAPQPATPALTLKPVAPSAASKPAPAGQYRVNAGDTLYGIARKHRISPDLLMKANNLNAETARSLRIGTLLTIPTQP